MKTTKELLIEKINTSISFRQVTAENASEKITTILAGDNLISLYQLPPLVQEYSVALYEIEHMTQLKTAVEGGAKDTSRAIEKFINYIISISSWGEPSPSAIAARRVANKFPELFGDGDEGIIERSKHFSVLDF